MRRAGVRFAVAVIGALLVLGNSILAQGGRGNRGIQIKAGEPCPPGTTEIRPQNCMAPEFPAPSILDYRPRSTLLAPVNMRPMAKFPAIDFHGHIQGQLCRREDGVA